MTRWQAVGFFALCLWSSAGWLTGDALPSFVSPVAGQGFRLLLIGLVGLSIALGRLPWGGFPATRLCLVVGLASVGLVGFPFLLLKAAEGRIASTDGVLVFAMLPVVIGLIGAARGAEPVSLRVLPYGLLAVAGVLILLPVRAPESSDGAIGLGLLVLAMLSTGLCLIWLHGLLGRVPFGAALALAGLSSGILLGLVAGTSAWNQWDLHAIRVESLRCLVIDLPEMALSIWLVKSISPQRLSARYVVAPLLTVLEGLLVLRPHLDVRTVLGLSLLCAGAIQLARAEPTGDEVDLRLV